MLKVTEDACCIILETDRSPVEAADTPEGVVYAKKIEIPKYVMLAMNRQVSAGEDVILTHDEDTEFFFAPSSLPVGGLCPGDIHGPTFGAIVGDVVTTVELTDAELEFVMSIVDSIEER